MKKTGKKEIQKDNYNCLIGNQIIVGGHDSGEKRWIAASDVKEKNISIKENQTTTLERKDNKNRKRERN